MLLLTRVSADNHVPVAIEEPLTRSLSESCWASLARLLDVLGAICDDFEVGKCVGESVLITGTSHQ